MIPVSITGGQVDTVLGGLNAIIATRRNLDSSIDGVAYLEYNALETKTLLSRFVYNYGQLCDGSPYRLLQDTQYFMLTSDIRIFSEERDINPKVVNLADRSAAEFPALSIYVNGLKVPDKIVYVYPNESGTDILVPESYLNMTGKNSFFIEMRTYEGPSQYLNAYVPGFSGVNLNVTFPAGEPKVNAPKSDNTLLFVSGVLLSKNFYTLTFNNTSISISFLTTVTGDIEIFNDPSIQIRSEVSFDSTDTAYFVVPESYIDPIHGPVSKRSCMFFTDGKSSGRED